MILGMLTLLLVVVLFLRKETLKSAEKARPLLEKLFETLQKIQIENIEFTYNSKSNFTTSIKVMLVLGRWKKKIGWINIFKDDNVDITYIQMDSNFILIEKFLKENGYKVILKEYQESAHFSH